MATSDLVKRSEKPAVQEASPCVALSGVGPQLAKQLARLGITSVGRLLFHLPVRYQDRTVIQSIRQLKVDEEAVIEGVIVSVAQPGRGRTRLLLELEDMSGRLHLRFFHVHAYQKKRLTLGARLRCYGRVRWGVQGLEMMHPEYRLITTSEAEPIEPYLTPFYPATEGLNQYRLRKLINLALQALSQEGGLPELMPMEVLLALKKLSLREALQFLHNPPRETAIADLLAGKTLAQQRLAFEELVTHRLSLLQIKQAFQSSAGIAMPLSTRLVPAFLQQLSFRLTGAQERVCAEIANDLKRANPMLRLVQGDVGSGKTVVAAVAVLQAIESGYQVALMAPTELLAEQHYRVFQQWFEPLNSPVFFLAGHTTAKARQAVFARLANAEPALVVGTHALFQKNAHFGRLGLIVVDEQHRFGVHQRALLREKGVRDSVCPHQLVMTATPIPRTLSMSFYADLDCSTIDELPPGRTPIMTSVISSHKREEVIMRVQLACHEGRQVYWVCPLIEESEVIAAEAVSQVVLQLREQLHDLSIGLIHGRMAAHEKEAAMQAFQRGETRLLVATTVIEVGVDVPNASIIVIENAERLGLAQLHQLRGRVGRGATASYCLLLYQSPLSSLAKQRLDVMRETTDGFEIAQKDLQLRGPGDVLGTRQTGELSFCVADLLRDSHLLAPVQEVADKLLNQYPEKVSPLIQRWLGHGSDYGVV